MATIVEDRRWRTLVAELRAWAIFVAALLVFATLAGSAVSHALPGQEESAFDVLFAFFCWQGLLLFAVVRYGRRSAVPG